MKLLKKISMLVVTLVAVVCVFGAVSKVSAETVEKTFTISFKDSTSDSNSEAAASTIKSSLIEDGVDFVDSISNSSKVYAGSIGIKMGSSKAIGSITIVLNKEYSIKKISVQAQKYGSDTGKIKCGFSSKNTIEASSSPVSNALTSFDYDLVGSSSEVYVATTAKRAYIKSITVTYLEESGSTEVNPVDTFKALTDAYASKLCFSYEVEGETYTVSNMVLRVAIVLDKALNDELIAKGATIGVTVMVNEDTDYTFAASNAVVEGDKVYLVAALDVPTTGYTTEVLFQAFVKVAEVKTEMDASLTTTVKDVASKYLTLADDPTVEEHNGVLTYLANLA